MDSKQRGDRYRHCGKRLGQPDFWCFDEHDFGTDYGHFYDYADGKWLSRRGDDGDCFGQSDAERRCFARFANHLFESKFR